MYGYVTIFVVYKETLHSLTFLVANVNTVIHHYYYRNFCY